MPSAAKRQRKKAGRQARVEELRRRAQAQRRRRTTILVLLFVFAASAAAVSVFTRRKPCPKVEPKLSIDRAKHYQATVDTSEGEIVIDLDSTHSPKTVNSFVALAKCGFYDNTTFHRVDKDFVIQGGDPKGDGTGGPGYKVVEAPPADLKYTVGTVAMAKTGPEAKGTSGSQFFIVTGEKNKDLPADYALLGRVVGGQDRAVERIRSVAVNGEKPVQAPKINKVTIAEVAAPAVSPTPTTPTSPAPAASPSPAASPRPAASPSPAASPATP
jgi:peptidyl-prolyl cis-trans isomerase B (cyclophilin B)